MPKLATLALMAAAALAAASQDVPRRDILGSERRLYSQRDEELVIRDFFQDRRGGYFVDVGCGWPVKNSNTFYLESRLGWRGIGVDAFSDYAKAWKKKRLRSLFRHFAVRDRSGETVTLRRSERGGLSGLEPQAEHAAEGVSYEPVTVETITLSKLLDDVGVERFDLLSMNVDGAELKALAGFDIDRFRPELCCIKARPANRAELDQYFAAHSYERLDRYIARDPANLYYARKPGAP